MTTFQTVYDRFFGLITDDMYLDNDPNNALWNYQDTLDDVKNILRDALPGFEFPRFNPYVYNNKSFDASDSFEADLTPEEQDIIARLMLLRWLERQINSVENIRMKYSGSDFKMTSQANHLAKLLNLQTENERKDHHYQRLYKRRRTNSNNMIESNWSVFREISQRFYDD